MLKRRFKCLLCGRDKFTQKSAHYCKGVYRKHHIRWEEITPEWDLFAIDLCEKAKEASSG